ncbi:MAG: hypothetical protein EOP33_02480 [Rickettsiaceae bacterium]|nr:MAG: hypothetical protein EOP33_02480 [Rickettsiaceae bacterium]
MMNNQQSSPIIQAIADKNLEEIKSIIEANPNSIFDQDQCGNTPVYTTISTNNTEALKIILKHNAKSVFVKNNLGIIPATFAISWNKLEALNLLLTVNNHSGKKDQQGNTLAFQAINCDNVEALEMILKFDPSSIYDRNKENDTLLHLAVGRKNLEIVHFLLKHDSNLVEQTNNYGQKAIDLIFLPTGLSSEELHEQTINNQKITEQLNDASITNQVINFKIKDGVTATAKVQIKNIDYLISAACKLFSKQPLILNNPMEEHKSKNQIIKQISNEIELSKEQFNLLEANLNKTKLKLVHNNGIPALKELAGLSPFINILKIILDDIKSHDEKEQELWAIVESQATIIPTNYRADIIDKYSNLLNEISRFNPEIAEELKYVMTCTDEQMQKDQQNNQETQITELLANATDEINNHHNTQILGEVSSMDIVE